MPPLPQRLQEIEQGGGAVPAAVADDAAKGEMEEALSQACVYSWPREFDRKAVVSVHPEWSGHEACSFGV